MNNIEIDKCVKGMKKFRKTLTKKKSVEFLIRAGICNKDKSLTKNYK